MNIKRFSLLYNSLKERGWKLCMLKSCWSSNQWRDRDSKRKEKERKERGRGIITKSCEYGLKHAWDRYDQNNAKKGNEIQILNNVYILVNLLFSLTVSLWNICQISSWTSTTHPYKGASLCWSPLSLIYHRCNYLTVVSSRGLNRSGALFSNTLIVLHDI